MFQIGLALMRTCTLHTFIGLWSSIITLFRCQNRSVIANHSIQFARKSVIANIISIGPAPTSSTQLNSAQPAKCWVYARARAWMNKHMAAVCTKHCWISLILINWTANWHCVIFILIKFCFFLYFSSLTLVRYDCENHERFLVGGLKFFLYYYMLLWSDIFKRHGEFGPFKRISLMFGCEKNARAHTQFVMWYEVMWCCVCIIPFLWCRSRFRRLHTCMFFRWKWIFFVAQSVVLLLVLIWLDRLQLFSSHHHIFLIIFAGACFLKPTIYITSMQKLRNSGHSVHISLSFFFALFTCLNCPWTCLNV